MLISCPECSKQISASSAACPECGARIALEPTKLWLLGPAAGLAFLLWWAASTGTPTTKDLAASRTEECMQTQGDGAWRGSMGVSLETFCKTVGSLAAIKRACEIDPAKC